MKKKESETEQQPLKIGDKVFTCLSRYSGEVIKVEEKRGNWSSYGGYSEWREITVKIPIPSLDQPCFKDVLFVCREHEVKRASK